MTTPTIPAGHVQITASNIPKEGTKIWIWLLDHWGFTRWNDDFGREFTYILDTGVDPNQLKELVCEKCGAPPAFPKAVSKPYICLTCQPKQQEKASSQLLIVAAAIQKDGIIWTGARHCEIIASIIKCGLKYHAKDVQGFITNTGHFVNREDAAKIAIAAGQIEKLEHGKELFSEWIFKGREQQEVKQGDKPVEEWHLVAARRIELLIAQLHGPIGNLTSGYNDQLFAQAIANASPASPTVQYSSEEVKAAMGELSYWAYAHPSAGYAQYIRTVGNALQESLSQLARLKEPVKVDELAISNIEQEFIARLDTELHKRGVDTSNWDGDDDCAEIIANGIVALRDRAVENLSEKRDAALASLKAAQEENAGFKVWKADVQKQALAAVRSHKQTKFSACCNCDGLISTIITSPQALLELHNEQIRRETLTKAAEDLLENTKACGEKDCERCQQNRWIAEWIRTRASSPANPVEREGQ